ncbi:putative alpha-1,2-mannosidase [Arcticibacter tournemirensis]|uniref:Glycoside hydrolase family 92 protein n=1 Tax=Arcticibacter tournemirensis TaxID=699437 RepID=A0A5M9GYP2_9SPHI|nr:GH92 family glycosyl hydrolase [Arcticibacter tournemirensis]KAA8479099.1 glycoside hydrolase family 92 protein [Arcticibacter tournemirensis]TQM48648.1 putative alpha-1,2-mannosidase [Arcticibacter tournemirensis]
MKKLLLLFLIIQLDSKAQENPVNYVNTLQGTNSDYNLSAGNTYPTIALPFGMHTWSAQTGKNDDGWKYSYKHKTIRGFQQAHACSPWVGDYAVFSLMPVKGKLKVAEEERASSFSHANEVAKPHYYKVTFDNKISTEISPTERGAHLRFSFPGREKAYVILDGYTKESQITILPGERKIVGWVNNGRFIPENFKSFFVIEFDKPFKSYGTWDNVSNKTEANKPSAAGKGAGAYLEFAAGATVQAKVASSYIDSAQAGLTLKNELGRFKQLEQTREAAARIWNRLLGRVQVEGGSEEDMKTFYSCLFRANLFSRMFFEYDKNGKPYYYSPYDGKVHSGYMYTDNGFWDTFRAQFPLNNILHPTYQGRYMQALLDAQKQCGWLPAWSFPGETGGMLGNHAISLLTDAWVKGIRSFDPGQALDAYFHEATNKGPWGGANGRQGWKDYYQLGFVAYPGSEGALSQTLEYAYDDFCGYSLAKLTGHKFYEDRMGKQMYNYRNVYDPSTRFMRARKANGDWLENFDPYTWGGPYTEGNAWHWHWSVFHDIQGLINLMGGNENFTAKLDSVFSAGSKVNVGAYGTMIHEMTEMVNANMGQYAHGNQPIQHMIYLYNYAGQPWKSQYYARLVMEKLYNATENGYPGDEDQGQMSSWYVLSALGFYSVCPGTDQYALGSPLFRKATITMENGKKFVINASGNSATNVYIKSATLNGKAYTKNYFTHSDIVDGGVLNLQMVAYPEKNRGISREDLPFSLSAPEMPDTLK